MKQDLSEHRVTARPATILAADGSILAVLPSAESPEPVPLAEVAPAMISALLAAEDHRYYTHTGVDLHAMTRALKRDVDAGRIVEGGSTITQQYVRNVLLPASRRTERKLKEVTMAIELDDRLRKNQILERYLNAVYFGDQSYGIQRAAQNFFGIDAADLSLSQAADLAGVLQSPSTLEPRGHLRASTKRRNVVLNRMEELGFISKQQHTNAIRDPLEVAPRAAQAHAVAPHFVQHVTEWMLKEPAFGKAEADRLEVLRSGKLTVETTLDPRVQALAEMSVASVAADPTLPSAALVAMDPRTGAVLGYVGGRDFYGSAPSAQFDLAGSGKRSPGSTFKPFVLAAALQEGIQLNRHFDAPATIDIPIPGQAPWHVQNYDGSGSGSMSLTEATVSSVNTVYAQLIHEIGAEPVVKLAASLGVRSPLSPDPAVALGGSGVSVLDMASAYSTLANDGIRHDPVLVRRVLDGNGKVLWSSPTTERRALDETIVRQVNDVLSQVVARGTGVNARIGRPVIGKTGTSEDWGDAWFIGSTPQLTVATWVGFPDAVIPMIPPRTPITVAGGTWPAKIFQQFASAALADTPAIEFPAAAPTSNAVATPTLLGIERHAATTKLTKAGIPFDVVEKPSVGAPKGIVIGQRPLPGSPLKAKDRVVLEVSTGRPQPVAVANVLGMQAAQARTILEAQGFGVRIEKENESPPPPYERLGAVWKQSIIPGSVADVGLTITLTVNRDVNGN